MQKCTKILFFLSGLASYSIGIPSVVVIIVHAFIMFCRSVVIPKLSQLTYNFFQNLLISAHFIRINLIQLFIINDFTVS